MSFWCLQFLPKNEQKQVDLSLSEVSYVVVKLNLFVFLEEMLAWKKYFDFVWPLIRTILSLKNIFFLSFLIWLNAMSHNLHNMLQLKMRLTPANWLPLQVPFLTLNWLNIIIWLRIDSSVMQRKQLMSSDISAKLSKFTKCQKSHSKGQIFHPGPFHVKIFVILWIFLLFPTEIVVSELTFESS